MEIVSEHSQARFRGVRFVYLVRIFAMTLFDAARQGDAQAIQDLLAKGENPNELDEHGQTPLHLAARALGQRKKPRSRRPYGRHRSARGQG